MKRACIILLFFAVTIGCGLTNSDNDLEKSEIPSYLLFEQKQLPISVLRGVDISSTDILHIYGDENWLESLDHGKTFRINRNPDGVYFTKILKFNDTYYALGAHPVNHPLYGDIDSTSFFGGYTNSIFISENAVNWEQKIAMRDMRDFILQDDSLLHMSIDGGINTFNIVTELSREKMFFSSRLTDLINDFYITKTGAILAGCHDGIYRSIDKGQSWVRTSKPEISKDDDSVEHFFKSKNSIYAVGEKIHISKDDGVTWNPVEFGFTDDRNDFQELNGKSVYITDDGYMYSVSYFGVLISKTKDPKNAKFILKHAEDSYEGSASRYDEILVFSNGDILIVEETLKYIRRGVRKLDSPFWHSE